MGKLLDPWSAIRTLHLKGTSQFIETDKENGNVVTSPLSRFDCWFADLELTKAKWSVETRSDQDWWHWFPFANPVRYRIDLEPWIQRGHNGEKPGVHAHTTEICDGKTVTDVWFDGETGRPNHYFLKDYRLGRWMGSWDATGLRFIPPFIFHHHHAIVAEAEQQASPPEPDSQDPSIRNYSLSFPRTLLTIDLRWHTEHHWYTSIEATVRGIPTELLDKVRNKENLTESERHRLRNERVVTETCCYDAREFKAAPQSGITFPQKLHKVHDARRTKLEWSWNFDGWEVLPALPDELFVEKLEKGVRVRHRKAR